MKKQNNPELLWGEIPVYKVTLIDGQLIINNSLILNDLKGIRTKNKVYNITTSIVAKDITFDDDSRIFGV